MKKLIMNVKTKQKDEIVDITTKLSNLVKDLDDQMIVVSIPHTTAAITINENYDSDVKTDIIYSLNKISPDYSAFRHMEGNSDAHIKASLFGRSEQIAVIDGELDLGRWEGVYFCEFDGARTREVWVYVN